MQWSVEHLSWLPRAPGDFRARCKALTQAGASWGRDVRFLASHGLGSAQLVQLASAIEGSAPEPSGLTPFKLAFLSNGATNFISPCLVASAARHGILLERIDTPFDQVVQETMDPESRLHRSAPNGIVLALDSRALPLDVSVGTGQSWHDAAH